MSFKTPLLNCESRIGDSDGRRIRQMARWSLEGWLDHALDLFKDAKSQLAQVDGADGKKAGMLNTVRNCLAW